MTEHPSTAPCPCTERHPAKRIVLTGGPGAGKTAVLELVRHALCEHVRIVPEAASIVFGGGFPRDAALETRRAGQRAIYCVQRELEAAAMATNPSIMLCDRGTVDGVAYWPGPDDLWSQVGTTLDEQLVRYAAVLHLRTPDETGYDHSNPLRVETVSEARAIDERIAIAWQRHPRRFEIPSMPDFVAKSALAVTLLRAELPPCCFRHAVAVSGVNDVR